MFRSKGCTTTMVFDLEKPTPVPVALFVALTNMLKEDEGGKYISSLETMLRQGLSARCTGCVVLHYRRYSHVEHEPIRIELSWVEGPNGEKRPGRTSAGPAGKRFEVTLNVRSMFDLVRDDVRAFIEMQIPQDVKDK